MYSLRRKDPREGSSTAPATASYKSQANGATGVQLSAELRFEKAACPEVFRSVLGLNCFSLLLRAGSNSLLKKKKKKKSKEKTLLAPTSSHFTE
jgi:hypothetical protein